MGLNSKALTQHEIRDPIHTFVRLDSDEVCAVNSPPFQRLRHIHQLALTSLIYPGATHKRFEHCLGVMELAGRIYDSVTNPDKVLPEMRYLVPRVGNFDYTYWRRVLRMAALCHDLGHLPFSHAAEDLLPKGYSHERISKEIIESAAMQPVWDSLKIQKQHVSKLAVGAKYSTAQLDDWESILSEIIIGDTFGADRIDYLLRDSHHVGVAYGKFDHYRLIDTMRILPKGDFGPPDIPDAEAKLSQDQELLMQTRREAASKEPTLGIESGGLQSAEGLLWARYFMWSQVYTHHVRRVYDVHLKDFLSAWLKDGKFSVDPAEHILVTDNEVLAELQKASENTAHPGHAPAKCIVRREHYRLVYEENTNDRRVNLEAFPLIESAMGSRFGKELVRKSTIQQKSEGKHFPILSSSGDLESSINRSATLAKLPAVSSAYLYVSPEIRAEVKSWLSTEKKDILSDKGQTKGENELSGKSKRSAQPRHSPKGKRKLDRRNPHSEGGLLPSKTSKSAS